MNPISDAWLARARENTAEFQQNPHVKAILVTGSVAKGTADDNTHIDTAPTRKLFTTQLRK